MTDYMNVLYEQMTSVGNEVHAGRKHCTSRARVAFQPSECFADQVRSPEPCLSIMKHIPCMKYRSIPCLMRHLHGSAMWVDCGGLSS